MFSYPRRKNYRKFIKNYKMVGKNALLFLLEFCYSKMAVFENGPKYGSSGCAGLGGGNSLGGG